MFYAVSASESGDSVISGEIGDFYRLTNDRKDFSAIPPKNNIVQTAFNQGIRIRSIKLVEDFHMVEDMDMLVSLNYIIGTDQ